MTNSTGFDGVLDAQIGHVLVTASVPTTPVSYYGNRVGFDEWRGGEVIYNSADNRIYVQTATSGVTATWKRLLTQLATSTTSSSTSSSSTTSSSTSSSSSSSTSSSSSSTSTSTSTSSSSSSSSTTSSSTTTS